MAPFIISSVSRVPSVPNLRKTNHLPPSNLRSLRRSVRDLFGPLCGFDRSVTRIGLKVCEGNGTLVISGGSIDVGVFSRHVPRDNMSFGRKGREGFCPSHKGNQIIRMFCNFIHHRYTAKLVTNSHCIIRKWIKLNPLQSPKSVALLLQGRTHMGRNSGGKSHLGIWAVSSTSDEGSQYYCGRVGRGIQPPFPTPRTHKHAQKYPKCWLSTFLLDHY